MRREREREGMREEEGVRDATEEHTYVAIQANTQLSNDLVVC